VIVATTLIHFAAAMLARRSHGPMRRAAAAASTARRAVIWFSVLIIDVLTVIVAWGIGQALAVAITGQAVGTNLNVTLYLNAFLAVHLVRMLIRSVFRPGTPEIRIAPFTDAAARRISRRLGLMVVVLGYGLMFVVPVVDAEVSRFVGAAVEVVVYVIVVLAAMAMVLYHRRHPTAWVRSRENAASDPTLRLTAWLLKFWHVPALIYLLVLFVTAVSRSGTVGPMLRTTLAVLGVIALGALVETALGRLASRGIKLPDEIGGQVPNLELRLNNFMRSLRKAARAIVTLVTIGAALDVSGLVDVGGWFAATFGEDFASALVSVILIFIGAFVVWLIMASWVDYRLTPDQTLAASARQQTLLTLLRNAATVAIVVLTLMFTLSELGLDIAPLIASAGVFGLALGFGAQKLVQDIITGIFIQFENAINVGDVVTASGITGGVERLTIRSVTLRTLDGTVHIIPFSSVDMVSNFNKGFAFHVADIGIAYREDVDEAKALMFEAFDDLKASEEQGGNVLGAMEWFGVNELGDNAVVLRARIRTRPGAQWGVGRLYNEKVKKRFDAAGVEIPFPQRTLWFGESREGAAPPARVLTQSPSPSVPGPKADADQRGAAPTADAPMDVEGDGEGRG
jgi:small conductance mechanosensitive channel